MPTFNLNKENFWNALKEQYPEAVEHFCNWIDAYKNEVGWDALFAPGIKFHDIPYDMQNGIIARFDLEKFNGKKHADWMQEAEPGRMRDLFADVQKAIKNRSIKLN